VSAVCTYRCHRLDRGNLTPCGSTSLDGITPQEIVAFTFTERAAASLKSRILLRIAELIGPAAVERAGPMYIGTIHSYCFRLLQEHVPEFAKFDVLDDHRHSAPMSRESTSDASRLEKERGSLLH
jgi:superfamily I DNA/RNA helicase